MLTAITTATATRNLKLEQVHRLAIASVWIWSARGQLHAQRQPGLLGGNRFMSAGRRPGGSLLPITTPSNSASLPRLRTRSDPPPGHGARQRCRQAHPVSCRRAAAARPDAQGPDKVGRHPAGSARAVELGIEPTAAAGCWRRWRRTPPAATAPGCWSRAMLEVEEDARSRRRSAAPCAGAAAVADRLGLARVSSVERRARRGQHAISEK